ncbi:hypothetical protein N9100_00395 [Gammaproteobacteria bacterium]|nr:hypothetical protein [Gammaproteobacteria bacterium]
MKKYISGLFLILLATVSSTVLAGQAEIIDVRVSNNQDSFRFDVTLKHDDTGWDHYADGWEVISPAGDVLGKRVLAHPHVNEQPFTRSLSGVRIPQGVNTVSIRAHDSVHGYNEKMFVVDLSGSQN